jgi:hypothetical protein
MSACVSISGVLLTRGNVSRFQAALIGIHWKIADYKVLTADQIWPKADMLLTKVVKIVKIHTKQPVQNTIFFCIPGAASRCNWASMLALINLCSLISKRPLKQFVNFYGFTRQVPDTQSFVLIQPSCSLATSLVFRASTRYAYPYQSRFENELTHMM